MLMEKYLWTTSNGNLFLKSKSILIENTPEHPVILHDPLPHITYESNAIFFFCVFNEAPLSHSIRPSNFLGYCFSSFSLTTNQISTKLYCSFQFSSHQQTNMMSWRNRILEFMAKDVVSRVIEKLSLLLIQEPAALVGVEEQLQFIEKELRSTRIHGHYSFVKELMQIAYNVEDVMDDLILKQAARERKRGFLRRFVLFITRSFININFMESWNRLRYNFPN